MKKDRSKGLLEAEEPSKSKKPPVAAEDRKEQIRKIYEEQITLNAKAKSSNNSVLWTSALSGIGRSVPRAPAGPGGNHSSLKQLAQSSTAAQAVLAAQVTSGSIQSQIQNQIKSARQTGPSSANKGGLFSHRQRLAKFQMIKSASQAHGLNPEANKNSSSKEDRPQLLIRHDEPTKAKHRGEPSKAEGEIAKRGNGGRQLRKTSTYDSVVKIQPNMKIKLSQKGGRLEHTMKEHRTLKRSTLTINQTENKKGSCSKAASSKLRLAGDPLMYPNYSMQKSLGSSHLPDGEETIKIQQFDKFESSQKKLLGSLPKSGVEIRRLRLEEVDQLNKTGDNPTIKSVLKPAAQLKRKSPRSVQRSQRSRRSVKKDRMPSKDEPPQSNLKMIDLDKDFEQILNDLNFSNAQKQQQIQEESTEQTRLMKSLTFEEVKVPSCKEEEKPCCTIGVHALLEGDMRNLRAENCKLKEDIFSRDKQIADLQLQVKQLQDKLEKRPEPSLVSKGETPKVTNPNKSVNLLRGDSFPQGASNEQYKRKVMFSEEHRERAFSNERSNRRLIYNRNSGTLPHRLSFHPERPQKQFQEEFLLPQVNQGRHYARPKYKVRVGSGTQARGGGQLMNPQFMVSAHMQSSQQRKRILSLDRVKSDGDPHDPGVTSGVLSINQQALLDNCSLESINLEEKPAASKPEIKFVDQKAEKQAYAPPKSAIKSQFDLTFSEQMHSQEPTTSQQPKQGVPPISDKRPQLKQEFNYPPREEPSQVEASFHSVTIQNGDGNPIEELEKQKVFSECCYASGEPGPDPVLDFPDILSQNALSSCMLEEDLENQSFDFQRRGSRRLVKPSQPLNFQGQQTAPFAGAIGQTFSSGCSQPYQFQSFNSVKNKGALDSAEHLPTELPKCEGESLFPPFPAEASLSKHPSAKLSSQPSPKEGGNQYVLNLQNSQNSWKGLHHAKSQHINTQQSAYNGPSRTAARLNSRHKIMRAKIPGITSEASQNGSMVAGINNSMVTNFSNASFRPGYPNPRIPHQLCDSLQDLSVHEMSRAVAVDGGQVIIPQQSSGFTSKRPSHMQSRASSRYEKADLPNATFGDMKQLEDKENSQAFNQHNHSQVVDEMPMLNKSLSSISKSKLNMSRDNTKVQKKRFPKDFFQQA